MKRKTRVYVAGPLSGTMFAYLANCHKMMHVAEELRIAGYSVYVPCLDIMMALVFGNADYEAYQGNSLPWVDAADCLCLVEGWESSRGTGRELARAGSLRIPAYKTVAELMRHQPVEREDA